MELSLTSPLLHAGGRRLLSLLGQLPDGIARLDLDAVFQPGGARAAANLRQLGLAFGDETGRLRVLAPIREYVAAGHPPAAEDLGRAVGHYCALLAKEGDAVGTAGGAEAAEIVAAETGNLTRLIGVAVEQGRWAEVADAAWGLGEYMRFTGADLPGLWDHILRRVHDSATPLQQAKILFAAGALALDRSDHEGARVRFEEALALYRRVGSVLGAANCIQGLGDIVLGRSDHEGAGARFEKALALFRQIAEPYSTGMAHRRLARLASGSERRTHVAAAREAWLSIDRPDLVADLDEEFGPAAE
ncbi:MAG TPA: tetratricopeptide repeat protein [Streptosporangiaceae bacterium]|nr:tetratricopeptide repeat protein [Streptosporangiaceae bacterium]